MKAIGGQSDCCKNIKSPEYDTATVLGTCPNIKKNEVYNCNLNNNDLIMVISDASTGKIVNVNDAACKFYGYNRAELLSKYINDINNLTHEEIQDQFPKIKDNKEIRYSAKFKTKNNEIKYLEVYISNLSIENRELINFIIFDITDKVERAKELEESKDRYKKLVQLSPHALFVHTGEKFIFVNKQGAKLLEVPHRKELIGKSTQKFAHENYKKDMFEKFDRIKKTNKKIVAKDMKIVTANGKVVDVSMSSSVVGYDGEEAILTILTDISERKEKEKLLKKAEENKRKMNEMIQYDKLKTEFFANISHELRTPINVILGSLQLLDKYNNDYISNPDKLNDTIKTTKQNCFRLLRLINNLIDITKIDSGFFNLNLQNNNIIEVIENIVLSVSNYCKGSKKINLIFDTTTEEKIMAFDPDKLERIILNLLSNAIKFTGCDDHIKVSVIDKGDKINISVKDTGIGIQKDQLNIIFDRFRQVNKSLTRDHEGSGIGLSLVKTFVEMHDGKITVDSEYGKGTEFIMEFPCKKINPTSVKESGVDLFNKDIKNINNYVERISIEFSDIYS